MADGPLVLAVDQGTSSTKALVVDARGAVVASGSVPIGLATPAPGRVEQDPEELWASCRGAVEACLQAVDPARVVAVGLSNQRESLVLWDRATGRALGPMISWQDQRTVEMSARLAREGHADTIRALSGLPLDPMFSALKAGWLLDEYDPDRRRSSAGELCLGTVDSWLLYCIGGSHVIEVGNASRTQLLNVREGTWDDELLEIFRVPRRVLPRILPSTATFCHTRGLAPLADGVPVAGVMGDSHAALFAQMGWRLGRVKVTYGSGSSVMAVTPVATSVPPGLCLTIPWDIDGRSFAMEGTTRAAGSTLVWLAGLLDLTVDEVIDLGAGVSNEGVYLVPAFNGLAAPWWDDSARGLVCGLTYASGREQLARAALESIGHQVEDVVEALEHQGLEVSRLLADGGPASNSSLMQFQADISGRRIERARVQNLSALGVAHLAAMSVGLWSLQDMEELARPTDDYEPRSPADLRDQHRAGWLDAVRRARLS